jgi:hypothetical protein
MIITFRTQNQLILWKTELVGQLSDGHWENSRPYDHWKDWCNATALVGPNVGRDFYPKRDVYGLTSKALLEVVGERMRAAVRVGRVFGLEVALKCATHTMDMPYRFSTPVADGAISADYLRKCQAEIEAMVPGRLVELDAVANDVDRYTHNQLLMDLREMKAAMRTVVR